jgi:hypothetical protein
VKTVRTDFDGFFLFEGVPYGEYDVRMVSASAQILETGTDLGRRAVVSDANDSVRLGTIAIGSTFAAR